MRVEKVSCLDITPTILSEFGLPVPSDLQGNVLDFDGLGDTKRVRHTAPFCPSKTASRTEERENPGYSRAEEEMVKNRLMELGYI